MHGQAWLVTRTLFSLSVVLMTHLNDVSFRNGALGNLKYFQLENFNNTHKIIEKWDKHIKSKTLNTKHHLLLYIFKNFCVYLNYNFSWHNVKNNKTFKNGNVKRSFLYVAPNIMISGAANVHTTPLKQCPLDFS